MGTFIYTYITAERYIHLGRQFIYQYLLRTFNVHILEASDSTITYLFQRNTCHIKTKRQKKKKKKEANIMFTAALFAMSKTETISSFVTAINHITCPAQNPSVTSQGFQNNPNVFLFTPNLFLRSKRPGPGLQLQSYPIPISYLAFSPSITLAFFMVFQHATLVPM